MDNELKDLPPKERIKTILDTLDQAARTAELGQIQINPTAIREVVAQLRTALKQAEVR